MGQHALVGQQRRIMAAGDRLPDQVGSWQVSFLEAGDQSAADFAMRQHRVEYGAQASFQRCMETDDRQRMGADVTCGLVERDDPPWRTAVAARRIIATGSDWWCRI